MVRERSRAGNVDPGPGSECDAGRVAPDDGNEESASLAIPSLIVCFDRFAAVDESIQQDSAAGTPRGLSGWSETQSAYPYVIRRQCHGAWETDQRTRDHGKQCSHALRRQSRQAGLDTELPAGSGASAVGRSMRAHTGSCPWPSVKGPR